MDNLPLIILIVSNIHFVLLLENILICMDNKITLNCSENEIIDVMAIDYGRFQTSFCIPNFSSKCNGTTEAGMKITARCENKTNCEIVNNGTLLSSGNCSRNVEPYLQLRYLCRSNYTDPINQQPKTVEDNLTYLFGVGAAVLCVVIIITGLAYIIIYTRLKQHKSSILEVHKKQTSSSTGMSSNDYMESHYDEINLEDENINNSEDKYGYNHLAFDLSDRVDSLNSLYHHSNNSINGKTIEYDTSSRTNQTVVDCDNTVKSKTTNEYDNILMKLNKTL